MNNLRWRKCEQIIIETNLKLFCSPKQKKNKAGSSERRKETEGQAEKAKKKR